MATIKIKTVEELDLRSTEIQKSVKDIGKDIQSHIVDLMKYTASTRDCGPSFRFITPLLMVDKDSNKSHSFVRASAIKKWLEEFGFCVPYTHKKTGKKSYRLAKDKLDGMSAEQLVQHFKTAAATKWNVYTPDPEFKPMDLDKMLASMIKRIETELDRDDVLPEQKAKHKVDPAKLAKLRELAA